MKHLTIFVASLIAVASAKSVTLLKSSEITEELINNPRYLLYEREDGLFEVEDFETAENHTVSFVADSDIIFHIYTPERPGGDTLRASQVTQITQLTGFNPNRDTVVISHGWRNHHLSPVNTEIRTALLSSRNVNVIVVDWRGIADQNYVSSQGSVLAVGNFVGDFLIQLNNQFIGYLDRITLVGHSLGAHVAGNIGARTLGLVNTIVGLDPAGPLFSANNINNRLDPTDGQYVHVIHSNDGMLGFGIPMGDVDYYPNGGSVQAGCGIDLSGSCSHSRAYFYYAESINNNRFVSALCASYSVYQSGGCFNNPSSNLGFWPVERASVLGGYYLRTNSNPPFAIG